MTSHLKLLSKDCQRLSNAEMHLSVTTLLHFLIVVCIYSSQSWTEAKIEGGMLFPRESESRQIQDLCGMWNFRADFSPHRNEGIEKMWFNKWLSETGPVMPMPVPSSFNDITSDWNLQNFVGWVWYDREFYVSSDWKNRRVVLRVGSAHYNAIVWINGKELVTHSGGHLPFEAVANNFLDFSGLNRITIAINNTLTPHTLPPGTISFGKPPSYPPGYFVQNLQFDFFNYAGLHRKVQLYTTPLTYVDDITIETGFSGTTGYLNYTVRPITHSNLYHAGFNSQSGSSRGLFLDRFEMDPGVSVEVIDRNGTTVAKGQGQTGSLTLKDVNLWWPFTTKHDKIGYQYALKVTVGSDVYRQPFGFRTVHVTDKQLLINNEPFYCHGAAKHEDADIRGKGLDFALIARDFNLMKWLGANCFRTSHYPYAEEIMDQADEQGIVVIDECPGIGITRAENFGNISLAHHLEVMEELVRRDKNRPAVIMWSVANEPTSGIDIAGPYFKSVIEHTKSLDKTRLVTFVIGGGSNDKAAQYTDVICINRYFGWYEDIGQLSTIPYKLTEDLNTWYEKFGKPLMITEYGADTVQGQHSLPSFVFTEDYQVDFMREYHCVFDEMRKKFLVGEMVWNFADFMTPPSVMRVFGCRKGVFTRDRQPKRAAHMLRERYWNMINGTLLNKPLLL